MLTLFAVPKPFRGSFSRIQRNAIASWIRLRPPCEVILFGNEDGTEEAAKEFGARHVPEADRNEYGTPLLHGFFDKAERLASEALLCYVNCDMVLMGDFMRAVCSVSRWRKRFLMVGQSWNLRLTRPLAFESRWERHLQNRVWKEGDLRGKGAQDYFVFSRGVYPSLPPFAVGRIGFDNWLVWKANSLRVPVVDATLGTVAIHQDHDYSHVPGGRRWTRRGEEARRNLSLAGGERHLHTLANATHWLGPSGLKVNRIVPGVRRGRVPPDVREWRKSRPRLLRDLLALARPCGSRS